MSKLIFEIEQSLLEKELAIYIKFLDDNLREHDVPRPDISKMTDVSNRIKEKMSQDVGKSFEELFSYIVCPNWKLMFDADNFIDTGKTLDEQKKILEGLLYCLQTHRQIDPEFMSEDVRTVLNTQFLNQEYKCHVLVTLLKSEYALCDPSISWKDALLHRIRIMFYSGLFIGDFDKIEDVLDVVNNKQTISILPGRIVAIMKEFTSFNFLKETLTVLDIIRYAIFISIGCGPSDDYMDLDEDIQNNKITGITQCTKDGIPAKHVLSTTLEYLKTVTDNTEYTATAKTWFIDLMSLMYVDTDACFEYCKSVSPYGYKIIFQRKE